MAAVSPRLESSKWYWHAHPCRYYLYTFLPADQLTIPFSVLEVRAGPRPRVGGGGRGRGRATGNTSRLQGRLMGHCLATLFAHLLWRRLLLQPLKPWLP